MEKTKSFVKTIVYAKVNKDGSVSTEERKVFVMNENDTHIRGIDFKYLNAEQQAKVIETFKDHEISDKMSFGKKSEKGDNKNEWDAAWRTFKKSNIQ